MIVSVKELLEYMSDVELTKSQRNAAETALLGIQGEIENDLGRPVEVRTFVETLVPDQYGDVWLSQTPVVEVTSVTSGGAAWPGYPLAWPSTSPAVLNVGVSPQLASYPGFSVAPVTVTYRAGVDGSALTWLKLAVMRVAARELTNRHDDSLGVKDLETTDAPLAELGLTEDEERRLNRLRRRVVA